MTHPGTNFLLDPILFLNLQLDFMFAGNCDLICRNRKQAERRAAAAGSLWHCYGFNGKWSHQLPHWRVAEEASRSAVAVGAPPLQRQKHPSVCFLISTFADSVSGFCSLRWLAGRPVGCICCDWFGGLAEERWRHWTASQSRRYREARRSQKSGRRDEKWGSERLSIQILQYFFLFPSIMGNTVC